MSSHDKPDPLRSNLDSPLPAQEVPGANATVTVALDRRRFLVGGAAVGIGGIAAAAIRDGELGGPAQTFRGSVPWREGSADAPPAETPATIESFADRSIDPVPDHSPHPEPARDVEAPDKPAPAAAAFSMEVICPAE